MTYQSTSSGSNKHFSDLLIARQEHIRKLMKEAGFQGIILNPGPSLTYLTGLDFHLMERPVVAIFTPSQSLILVIPELEKEKIDGLPYPTVVFEYGENPTSWEIVFRKAAVEANLFGKLGVEPTRFRFLELSLMQAATGNAQFKSAENILSALRMIKDEYELGLMKQAARIAQNALSNTLTQIKIGMSEKEIATELTLQLLRLGGDTIMPFSPIVSAGPNSANPHASPTSRKLSHGDLLVIDWGAYHNGYCSDITRTYAIGEIDSELQKIYDTTLNANSAARKIAAPGLAAEKVDLAARNVIENAGYGSFFTHRTGHGLGMEGHEAPYIRNGNNQILQTGMTFTIEPGIYLPGRGGVRIEDDVVITPTGSESLSDLPRELQSLG